MRIISKYDLVLKKVGEIEIPDDLPGRILTTTHFRKIFIAAGLHELAEEHFAMIAISPGGHILDYYDVAHGTVESTYIALRDIFKRAVLSNASRIVVAHNHPDTDVTLSQADIETLYLIAECCLLFNIDLEDNMIVCPDESLYFSQKEHGNLEEIKEKAQEAIEKRVGFAEEMQKEIQKRGNHIKKKDERIPVFVTICEDGVYLAECLALALAVDKMSLKTALKALAKEMIAYAKTYNENKRLQKDRPDQEKYIDEILEADSIGEVLKACRIELDIEGL